MKRQQSTEELQARDLAARCRCKRTGEVGVGKKLSENQLFAEQATDGEAILDGSSHGKSHRPVQPAKYHLQ